MQEEKKPKLVCVAELEDTSWRWFAKDFPGFRWSFLYSKPGNVFERLITTPNLTKMRIARDASRECRDALILFTHHPHLTYWCEKALGKRGHLPHVAWSFNFPDLPGGLRRKAMAREFVKVDRFIVYSSFEKGLYSSYFNIPAERIDVVLWGVRKPEVRPVEPLVRGDYICAIGGNGRDYETLMKAAGMLKDLRLELVARPRNVKGLKIPENVNVRMNIPFSESMNILYFSRFMVVPLEHGRIPTGHVTLCAAQHLGKTFVITDSEGIKDYVMDGINALTAPANDPGALAERIRLLWEDHALRERLESRAVAFARENLGEGHVKEHLERILGAFAPVAQGTR